MGIFPSLDPFEGWFDDPTSLNGYSYVDGDPVNNVDPSGMCWINNTATPNQQQTCYEVFKQYNEIVYAQHPDWPIHISELIGAEAVYWGNLSYGEFATQWNSSRPPASTDPGGELFMSYAPGLMAASFINPAPGPDDLLVGIGLLCVAGAALIASAGAIALPMRQIYHFANVNTSEGGESIPIPWPTDFDTRSQKWSNCSLLENSGGQYWNFDDALGAMQGEYNDNSISERKSEREITDSGHCALLGSHSHFYNTHGEYRGSITCCPCCSFGYPDVRCFIRWPH